MNKKLKANRCTVRWCLTLVDDRRIIRRKNLADGVLDWCWLDFDGD